MDALASGEVAFDPIAAALVWGCGLWIVTVWAAWFVRRSDRVFVGILPAGGLYAFALYYTGMEIFAPIAGGDDGSHPAAVCTAELCGS